MIKPLFRWIAVLPAATLGSLVVPVIIHIVNLPAPEWWRLSIMEFIKSAGGGATFVVFGALTAPKHKFKTVLALTILYSVFTGILLLIMAAVGFIPFSDVGSGGSGKPVSGTFLVAVVVFGVIGACATCLYIREQEKTEWFPTIK